MLLLGIPHELSEMKSEYFYCVFLLIFLYIIQFVSMFLLF